MSTRWRSLDLARARSARTLPVETARCWLRDEAHAVGDVTISSTAMAYDADRPDMALLAVPAAITLDAADDNPVESTEPVETEQIA